MRRKGKVDKNQSEIVACFRQLGASVNILSNVGDGCPDIEIGFFGHNCLVEIKSEKGKLTPAQLHFFDVWHGAAVVIRSTEQAVQLVNYMRVLYAGVEFDFEPTKDDM